MHDLIVRQPLLLLQTFKDTPHVATLLRNARPKCHHSFDIGCNKVFSKSYRCLTEDNKNRCFRCYYLFVLLLHQFKFLSTGLKFYFSLFFFSPPIEMTIYRKHLSSVQLRWREHKSLIYKHLFSFFFSLYFLAIVPVFYQIPVCVQN